MQTILEVGGSDRCMVWVTLIFLQGKWFFYAAFLVLMNTHFYRHKSDLPIQTHSYTVQIVNQWFWQFPIRIFTMTQLGLNCWPYTAWPTVHHIISVHVPMFFLTTITLKTKIYIWLRIWTVVLCFVHLCWMLLLSLVSLVSFHSRSPFIIMLFEHNVVYLVSGNYEIGVSY